MMKINSLSVDNFRGFSKKILLEFADAALILCDAPNGSGKTTLLDAIEWCLTGDIGRLSAVYAKRFNSTQQKRQYNLKTILKNKDRLCDLTEVSLNITLDNNIYIITRKQEDDTLLNPGSVTIYDGNSNNLDKQILSEWVEKESFYQYHVFDMQKAYGLLGKDKKDIEKFFVDFTRQHRKAESVVTNLEVFQKDIELRKTEILKKLNSEDKLLALREKVNNYVQAPEVLQYEKNILFENENVEIDTQSKKDLNQQLKKLYECGYSKVCEYIQILESGKNAKTKIEYLESIKKELIQYPLEIKEFIDRKLYEENQRDRLNEEIIKLKKIVLTKDNMEQNYKQIVELENKSFTEEYWKSEWEKIQHNNKRTKELQTDIKVLSCGDNVLNLLTTLLSEKNSIIDYRSKLRNSNKNICCPVCGSDEKFSNIDDNEILKIAQDYENEHIKILESKKKDLNRYNNNNIELINQIIEKSNAVLQERIRDLTNLITKVDLLTEKCKSYYEYIKKLQVFDLSKYSFNNMKTEIFINKCINETFKDLIHRERRLFLENEIEELLIILGYSADRKNYEEVLRDAENHLKERPQIIEYNRNLLSKKISSIQQYIKNQDFIDTRDTLKSLEEENERIIAESKELEEFNELAQLKVKNINKVLLDLKKEEYDKVGPYLSKIFKKLSRDVRIQGFKLSKRDGNQGNKELEILDQNGSPILNMFSDGQLSVFMLSYFLGNAFRLADKEKVSIYMMDDVTSCMDDINMLAFLDLIKYQLLKTNGAFSQLFFVSCNNRVQELLEWKAKGCGIKYKKIILNSFV